MLLNFLAEIRLRTLINHLKKQVQELAKFLTQNVQIQYHLHPAVSYSLAHRAPHRAPLERPYQRNFHFFTGFDGSMFVYFFLFSFLVVGLIFKFFGLKTLFFELLHAKPCRTIMKLS